jgi:hypothetical protein
MTDYRCYRVKGGSYFLRSTCWSVGKILWFDTLRFYVKRCGRRAGNGRSISMLGWCCRIICIVFGLYRPAMTIFPTAGSRSRFASCKQSHVLNDDFLYELKKDGHGHHYLVFSRFCTSGNNPQTLMTVIV